MSKLEELYPGSEEKTPGESDVVKTLETNEEVYRFYKDVMYPWHKSQGVAHRFRFISYATKTEHPDSKRISVDLWESLYMRFDDPDDENIQEMNEVSMKEDFYFWILSKKGRAFTDKHDEAIRQSMLNSILKQGPMKFE